jgi:hypothetical protein
MKNLSILKKLISTFFVVFITLLYFNGCSKQTPINTVTENTLTSDEVRDVMSKELGYDILEGKTADSIYSLPSENWIRNTFSSSYYNFLYSIKSNGYMSEENDCDKFAVLAYSYAHILHHNTTNKISKTGLTFGEFWYVSDRVGGHAINVIIVRNNNTNKVLFYEPQTQQIVNLSTTEKDTCSFWRF